MIHVVYTIYKKDSVKVHDVITCTNQTWFESNQVTGGILSDLRKKYPESEFEINISTVTSPGNQPND